MSEASEQNPLEGISFEGPELDAGDIVVDAICVVRVQSLDNGRSKIWAYKSRGIDDVTETGMLAIYTARDMTQWTHVIGVRGDGDDD